MVVLIGSRDCPLPSIQENSHPSPSDNGRISGAGEVPAQPLVREHRGRLQVPRRSSEGGSGHVTEEDAGGGQRQRWRTQR